MFRLAVCFRVVVAFGKIFLETQTSPDGSRLVGALCEMSANSFVEGFSIF